ncbi:unnamed protein product [Heligmosomoides polygyrus]|uniref:Retrotransposon protein n=1 Tax=Heligmosomoides polygyrus TaxID=6339 RepID=A0A183FT05_HELPZ|nr:unnamed protein product [Heligmosomoides polygyrus]
MADSIDWSNSEPPNRYVLAYGTQHCLIEQDYDHSIYEECSYVSSRTLVKCKSVRKKEDLRANGGVCEMHKKFYDSIKERFLCEERRLMQDNGQGKPKYSRFINQDGLIRNAGVFTEKDVLMMRKALLEKKIEYLTLHGEMTVERARREPMICSVITEKVGGDPIL